MRLLEPTAQNRLKIDPYITVGIKNVGQCFWKYRPKVHADIGDRGVPLGGGSTSKNFKSSGVAGPLAARCGGQTCRPFVLGLGR